MKCGGKPQDEGSRQTEVESQKWEGKQESNKMTNGHNGHSAPPILLTIAGFDPSCGAGTAADLKTFAAHGCYGIAAITSLTVQNTQGVESVHNTPSAELRAQLRSEERRVGKECGSRLARSQ